MLRLISNDWYKNIYILWGLPFTSMPCPRSKSNENIVAHLIANYNLWMRKVAKSNDPEVKRNSQPVLTFLLSEIRRRVIPEELKQMIPTHLTVNEESERAPIIVGQSDIKELIFTKGNKLRSDNTST